MAIKTYDKGDTVRLEADFTSGGTPADPTDVTLQVKQPNGTIDSYTYLAAEITRVTTGSYYRDVEMTQTGQLYYHFAGSGALVTAEETYLIVRPSEFD
jgi:hypothetical protein